MIIDLILDRKDGQPYNARKFYNDVMQYAETWPELANPITRAMDEGDENDVRRELCAYINGQDYNPAIKEYINSVQWLPEMSENTQYAINELQNLIYNVSTYASYADIDDLSGCYDKQDAATAAIEDLIKFIRQHSR